jgi:hypothetical protein
MRRRVDEEIEFNAICFHKQCIKEGEQLFNEAKYDQAVVHSIHKELCRNLRPESFQGLYEVPHKLAGKMLREFDKSLT